MDSSVEFSNQLNSETFAEKRVESFIRKLGFECDYEQPVYVKDDKERPRVWTPDFFLPELGIYVEVCGAKRQHYKFRKKIYEKNKIPVIFIHAYKYPDKWECYLIKEIKNMHGERSKKVESLPDYS